MFGNGNKSLSLAHVCREARAEVFFHDYRYIPVDGNIDGAERRWFSFSRDLMYWNTNAFLEDYFDDVTHCLPVCKKYRDQIQDLAIDDWLWYKWVMEEETREERYPRRRGETVKHWTHVLCRDLPSLKVVHLVVNDGQIDPYNGAKLELTRREKVLPFLLGYDWGLVRRQFGRAALRQGWKRLELQKQTFPQERCLAVCMVFLSRDGFSCVRDKVLKCCVVSQIKATFPTSRAKRNVVVLTTKSPILNSSTFRW